MFSQTTEYALRAMAALAQTPDQLVATVDAINEIAGNLNKDLMLKIAKCNYEAMTKTLQGYIV